MSLQVSCTFTTSNPCSSLLVSTNSFKASAMLICSLFLLAIFVFHSCGILFNNSYSTRIGINFLYKNTALILLITLSWYSLANKTVSFQLSKGVWQYEFRL